MLTPRLDTIVKHIKCRVAADIGTDHAYLPISLITENRADYVIASDIKEGPASIARENIKKNNLTDKIEVRVGPGLSVLSLNEAENIIIAGMGGEMIENIIKNNDNISRASRLILQPMNSQYELRHFLIENNYNIIDEDISTEGFKVYNIIIAESGKGQPFSKDIFYHIPPYLKKHQFYNELYNKKLREFTRVIKGLEESNECDFNKLEKYKKWLGELNEIK